MQTVTSSLSFPLIEEFSRHSPSIKTTFLICHISNLHNKIKFIFSSSIQIDFFTQTLTELNLYENKIGAEGAKYLSGALRVNKVSPIFSSSTQKAQIDFFTQTLTHLNLWDNQIGAQGAEQLADALRENRVSPILSSSTQKAQIDFFTQTLTHL